MKQIINITYLLMILFACEAYSQKNQKPPKTQTILDFDADVIEGERNAPSILVQMDLQAPNLDTLIFLRKNFNDFHSTDMKRKPKYRGQ